MITSDVQVLPNDQGVDRAELKCFHGVFNTEAVLRGIAADLVEVVLDELLLLHELHVRQRLSRQFDSLGRRQK